MNINWMKVALNIRNHMPLVQASEKIGRHRDWLSHLARGEITDPKFSHAVRLLDLHLDLCGLDKHREIMT